MATTPNQTHPSFEAPAKTQRRYTVGYVPNHGDTSTPALNLGGKWLREVGFDTGVGVTVKIVDGCIVLIPDSNEVQELRKQLQQIEKAFKGLKESMVGV
ncbi:SymE family type I addiction module toxin [Klebsiella michiganensis]|uniref:SymE family type I addiction module toxin n=1 Tax=Klebsiella michiganensis TaxID=1134687 RepID=UPI003883CF5B